MYASSDKQDTKTQENADKNNQPKVQLNQSAPSSSASQQTVSEQTKKLVDSVKSPAELQDELKARLAEADARFVQALLAVKEYNLKQAYKK